MEGCLHQFLPALVISVFLVCGNCALLLQSLCSIPLFSNRYRSGTMTMGDPASLKTEEGSHSTWKRSKGKLWLLSQVRTSVTSFAAEVMLTTSSGWIYPNCCILAGNHPHVQVNTKSDSEAGPAQITVIQNYITFLLSWLRSVNIDSCTHLFCIISLFWYDCDMLTGLTKPLWDQTFC